MAIREQSGGVIGTRCQARDWEQGKGVRRWVEDLSLFDHLLITANAAEDQHRAIWEYRRTVPCSRTDSSCKQRERLSMWVPQTCARLRTSGTVATSE